MPRKRQRSTTTKPEAAASTSSSTKQKKTAAKPKRTWLRKVEKEEEEEEEVFVLEGDEDDTNSVDEVGARMGTGSADSRPDTKEKRGSGKAEKKISTPVKVKEDETPARFVGAQIPGAEARKKWPHRYANKFRRTIWLDVDFSFMMMVFLSLLLFKSLTKYSVSDDSEEIVKARCHYTRAEVDRIIYDLYYDAHVQASDGEPDYICRISEMFESVDRTLYFTTQWYYRSTVTIIKDKYISDPKCVFFSEIRNDNPLECLTWKLNIVRLALNVDPENRRARSSGCDFYCDMLYLLPYSTFVRLPTENNTTGPESSTISNDIDAAGVKSECDEVCETSGSSKSEVALLDLYSGCGAMSTGLCLGLNLKWAVDLNINACQSLRLNHPETQNNIAYCLLTEDGEPSTFREAIKSTDVSMWITTMQDPVRGQGRVDGRQLAACSSVFSSVVGHRSIFKQVGYLGRRLFEFSEREGEEKRSLVKNDDPEKKQYCFVMDDEDDSDDNDDHEDVSKVEKILEICYGDPKKNYGPDYDTWEPISGLINCREAIKNFVMHGYLSNILPLPGDVDVICGGPPCQGISGFNRFRNTKSPLDDPKNKQLIVFMDTVDFLRPKFVLIENVVDLLKFADGFIGRYAMGCLTNMKYQARLGMLGHTVFRSFVCGFFYGVLAQLRSHHNILSPLMMCLGEVSHL
ncbi:hypothetical protein POPTR_003G215800v4 [Populus trichocarpa]|uniref:Uncharacterized protein n=1 Tax=Populus trichocarpa TaxID=3694 RepID=A0ACC0TAT5_POPTR|nr:hypothetical protein POPTR_003G215800v4 [Populus trichocarpa]